MLRERGLNQHARVAERHTGTGLRKEEIIRRNLPLPHEDFVPETMEEQVICYADKFFSKTHLDKKRLWKQYFTVFLILETNAQSVFSSGISSLGTNSL